MKRQSISLREANQNFSRIIAAVEQGEAFSITRRGREVARLLPAPTDGSAGKQNSSPDGSTLEDAVQQESTLAERVLRLEARLAKLSAAISPADNVKK